MDPFEVLAKDGAGIQVYAGPASSRDAAVATGLSYKRKGCAVIIKEHTEEHTTKEYSLDHQGNLSPMP
jgi:hypothetical protein